MKIAKKELVLDNGLPTAVVWKWADGIETQMRISDLSEDMKAFALAMGISQKLGDCYAGVKSVEEAREAWQGVYDQIMDGNWNKKGTRGESLEILAEAIVRVMEENPATKAPEKETALEMLKSKTKEEIAAIKKKWPTIQVTIDEIKLERKKARAVEIAEDDDSLDELFAA